MIIYCISHKFQYELQKLTQLFLPYEKTETRFESDSSSGDKLYTEQRATKTGTEFIARLEIGGKAYSDDKCFGCLTTDEAERELSLMVFALLEKMCGFTPKWGILTGVRPSKLMMSKCFEMGEEEAFRYFTDTLLVSPDKAQLALTVAKEEQKIIAQSDDNSYSLYISIPFCPSRCSYCSFVSHSISSPSAKKLIPEYVDKLCEEIKVTAEKVKDLPLKLKSVYWGGGTPTTLSGEQLDTVLTEIENNFDLSDCLEYTVEAGRPDTITAEKLMVLKTRSVGRISINPQTFSDSVLKAIGRKHTVTDTIAKYGIARLTGFDSINMDLIAGLPTDTFESFKNSVDSAIKYSADNITVHTLALKRSSELVTENESINDDRTLTSKMLSYAYEALGNAGYHPYYMYRQSKSLGNLENTGWCKDGKECYYNVFMMEECQPIISLGAGGVTKLKEPGGKYIERIFNYKYPFEYISRFPDIVKKKDRISEFFSEYKLK